MPARRPFPTRRAPALALLVLPLLLGAGRLHTELKSSDPAKDTVLAASPERIVLTYTTEVQLALSSVGVGAAGIDRAPAASGTLAYLSEERHDVLVLPLSETLGNGSYTVSWTTAGPDGHPIRGTFDFTVDSPDAAGPATGGGVAGDTTPGSEAGEHLGRPGEPGARQGEPGARASAGIGTALMNFVLYGGLIAVLGGAVFRLLVLGRPAMDRESGEAIGLATRRAHRIVAVGTGLLLAILPLRLLAQAASLFPEDAAGNMLALATAGTPWAAGWWLHVSGLAVVVTGLVLAGGDGRRAGGWTVIAAGALVLPAVPLLSGHGWADSPRTLSAAATWLHVVAAGGWMGGLACLLLAGLPALREHGADAPGIAGMVAAFSRVAQAAVALLLVTGAVKVWIHVGAASDLWTTAWGRTLLIKDLLVAGVLVIGFYNWRVVRPALADRPDPGRLMRPAVAELLLGAAVVGATAFLVARPLS